MKHMNCVGIPLLFSLSLLGCSSSEEPAETESGPVTFAVEIENISGSEDVPTPIAPGIWVIHQDGTPLFVDGELDSGRGLEALAEDGSPKDLEESLDSELVSGDFDSADDGYDVGAIMPGEKFNFEVVGSPGDRISLAAMFVESNDYFFATPDVGVELFDDDGEPLDGALKVHIFDAGTEVDQPLGAGEDQALRQSAHNVGEAEGAPIEESDLNAGDYVLITLSPVEEE
jgi:hypothetical protein